MQVRTLETSNQSNGQPKLYKAQALKNKLSAH